MPTLILPELDDETYTRLDERARANPRSPEAEGNAILDQALLGDRPKLARRMAAVRERLTGRYAADPLAEIRDDRDRPC